MTQRIGDVSVNPNIIVPSSTDLDDMMRRAMAGCDASVERAQDARMERAWVAQAKADARRRNQR